MSAFSKYKTWPVITGKTHTKRFTAIFPRPPGWASARRELLDFMVQGKINRGRHTNHPAVRHSIPTNQCQPPSSPNFLQARCPSCHPTNSVTALKATSAFGLGKTCSSSPQRCYLHRLRTVVLQVKMWRKQWSAWKRLAKESGVTWC